MGCIPSPLVGIGARKSVRIPIKSILDPALILPSRTSATVANPDGSLPCLVKDRVAAICAHFFPQVRKKRKRVANVGTNQ